MDTIFCFSSDSIWYGMQIHLVLFRLEFSLLKSETNAHAHNLQAIEKSKLNDNIE